MQKNKKSIAKIILAIMVIFALAVPVSGIALATDDTAVLLSEDADLTAPAAEGEGPLVEGEMPEVDAESTETTGEEEEETNKFFNTFWALVPPVIAIALALITKEVYSSLLVGIIFGALLTTSFNVIGAIDNLTNQGFIPAVSDTAGILSSLCFLVL